MVEKGAKRLRIGLSGASIVVLENNVVQEPLISHVTGSQTFSMLGPP